RPDPPPLIPRVRRRHAGHRHAPAQDYPTSWPQPEVDSGSLRGTPAAQQLPLRRITWARRQHYDAIATALRPVYTAPTEAAATERFLEYGAVPGVLPGLGPAL